ncbi:hypothetical protein SSX86_015706 [Deinandra increscens subsp. villosa]|uniref:Protein TIFY n=1 Tax=Deinandra increscens subsp. villosa TaxID=3103831 RepID=A0AAP0CY94_9ASTR
MRRNCNLELRLVPPSPPLYLRQLDPIPSDNKNMVGGDLKERQNQELTIFYDGKVSVCDVTELQARTIIKLASEEMDDDKWRRAPDSSSSPSPILMSPGGLSMKKSLQRFLQKRKHRIQETSSPYHH